ncbi:hypothetical protein QEJ31_07080 [Pigmentibacter sp. JX0631]|uniref:hypothetical protein n=1 Tax=Pigmentibacter sp. JX0631 TaxID=2976982 RepID=UPI002469B962|nr:hypothetical protein [Pigmentibacter sp. JX0631]WGL61355.1 hypothetical protein QEJ31_07080 [Pigmentibacter sp. JX0631]
MRRVIYSLCFLLITFFSHAEEVNFVCVNKKNQYQYLHISNQTERNYGNWKYISRKITENYLLYTKVFKIKNSIDIKNLKDVCKNLFGSEYIYLQAFDPDDWHNNIYLISHENGSILEGFGKFNLYCRSCLGNRKISYSLVEFSEGLSDENKILNVILKN